MFEILTVINSIVIIVLVSLVVRLFRIKEFPNRLEQEKQHIDLITHTSDQNKLFNLKAGDGLPDSELVKIEVTGQLNSIGWLEMQIYNGTEWQLSQLDIKVEPLDKEHIEHLRIYRLKRPFFSAQPYSSLKQYLEENQHDFKIKGKLNFTAVGACIDKSF